MLRSKLHSLYRNKSGFTPHCPKTHNRVCFYACSRRWRCDPRQCIVKFSKSSGCCVLFCSAFYLCWFLQHAPLYFIQQTRMVSIIYQERPALEDLCTQNIIGLHPSYLSVLHRTHFNTRSQSCRSLYLRQFCQFWVCVNSEFEKASCFKAPHIWNESEKTLKLCTFRSVREFSDLIFTRAEFSCNCCS